MSNQIRQAFGTISNALAKVTNTQAKIMSVAGTAFDAYQAFAQDKSYYIVSKNNQLLLENGRFVSLELISEGDCVSVPIEQGSFAMYNKAISPKQVRIQMVFEENPMFLQSQYTVLSSVLDDIRNLHKGTDLVSIVTPVHFFRNYNLESYNYTQTIENSFGVLYVDLHFAEIRQVAPKFVKNMIRTQDAKNAANVSTVTAGKKQPQESLLSKGVNKGINLVKGWFS